MASFTAGTTFADGVANDVTAAKLGVLVTNATPTSGFIQDRTAETVIASNDTVLIGDASDSNNLKRMTVDNLMKAEMTGTINSTSGTIGTFNSTTATIPTLTSTTLITTGTGTAASPAIVSTGDTNNGLFFPAADNIAVSTNGTERVRVDSSGNVGVNLTNPPNYVGYKTLAINGSTGGNLELYNNSVLTGQLTSDSNGVFLRNKTSAPLVFVTSDTERLRIDSSGNVGIGATPSGSGFSVIEMPNGTVVGNLGNTSQTILTHNAYWNSSTGWIYKNSSAAGYYSGNSGIHTFHTATSGTAGQAATMTERLRIDSSGNVGIGTTSPVAKLQVESSNPSRGIIGVFNNPSSSGRTGSQIQITQGGVEDWVIGQPANENAFAIWNGRNTVAAGTERLRIDSSGNVIISGGVSGQGLSLIRNGSDGGGVINALNGATGSLSFTTNSTERLRIDSSGNVGIGTTGAVNKLEIVGSFGRGAPVTKTGDFTLADTENWLIVNKGSSCTVTLPAASSWTGREFTIKVITAHTVVSASSNVVPRNSATAGTAILAATAGSWATLVSNGTNWVIMCGS